jgi:hypothetical protein
MGVNAPPGMWVRWLVLQLLWARMRGGRRGGRKEHLGRSGGLCAHWLLDGQRSGAEPRTR